MLFGTVSKLKWWRSLLHPKKIWEHGFIYSYIGLVHINSSNINGCRMLCDSHCARTTAVMLLPIIVFVTLTALFLFWGMYIVLVTVRTSELGLWFSDRTHPLLQNDILMFRVSFYLNKLKLILRINTVKSYGTQWFRSIKLLWKVLYFFYKKSYLWKTCVYLFFYLITEFLCLQSTLSTPLNSSSLSCASININFDKLLKYLFLVFQMDFYTFRYFLKSNIFSFSIHWAIFCCSI